MNLVTSLSIAAARPLQGRMKFQGMDISIENRRGSVRRGVDQDGNEWATKMKYPYGYIRKTEGTDGDHVDVFVGSDANSPYAYVIHIKNPKTGEYDEDKVMLGFSSERQAKNAFKKHYDNPERFYQDMTVMPIEEFKKKVLDKDNHGEKIAANNEAISMAYIDPIPSFTPPSMKKGKSRIPVDQPGEKDDSLLDVTKRKEAEGDRNNRLAKKSGPMPIGHTAIQPHTGSTTEYLNPTRTRY